VEYVVSTLLPSHEWNTLTLLSSQVTNGNGIHCLYCPPKSQMEMEYIVSTVTSGIRCLMALVTAEWLAHWMLARNKAHFISSINM